MEGNRKFRPALPVYLIHKLKQLKQVRNRYYRKRDREENRKRKGRIKSIDASFNKRDKNQNNEVQIEQVLRISDPYSTEI